MDLAERLILVRQALYRFYAGLLLYPEVERRETLAAGAVWLEQALEDPAVASALGVTDATHSVLAWPRSWGDDVPVARAEWVRLFGSSRDGFCFPYEGAYRGPEAAGPLVAELQLEYARAGLVLSVDDLPDHVSIELEYMSYLCGLELETLRAGEDNRRGRIVKAQYLFLERHLGQWLPTLLEQVVKSDGGAFALVCDAAKEMAAVDRATLASRVPGPATPA